MNSDEYQYLNLVNDILENGIMEEGRNGNTKSVFGRSMKFSLTNNKIPILTTKKIAWKTCLKELIWFISGKTDNSILKNKNVHIWDMNEKENSPDLGPIYGHQWRHFNAPYIDCFTDYKEKGIDQLQNIINQLKDPLQRYSRRLVLSSWNPCQIEEMALPPCHVLFQFYTRDNKLSCALYQRSGDIGLGVPFNIASYSFLTHLIAKHTGLIAHEFIYFLGDAHIYENHIQALQTQVKREPYDFPTLEIENVYDDIEEYKDTDFILHNYKHYPLVEMKMTK
jgi:thymidylate synthase